MSRLCYGRIGKAHRIIHDLCLEIGKCGGDGFVGGMLYGILKGWEPEKWIQFGWATGALATTMLTDYAQPADEDQVWSIWKGNARVQR